MLSEFRRLGWFNPQAMECVFLISAVGFPCGIPRLAQRVLCPFLQGGNPVRKPLGVPKLTGNFP